MLRSLLIILIIISTLTVNGQKSKGDTYYQQAKDILDKGDGKKSVKVFLSARTEYLKEGNYLRVLTCTQNVTMYYQDTGDGKAAEQLILETIGAIPKKTPEQLEIHADLQDNLAFNYLNYLNRTEDALKAYNESILLWEKTGKTSSPGYAFELMNRAVTYYSLSQFQSAVNDLLLAIPIYEKDPDTQPAALAQYYGTLGLNYFEMAQFEKSLASYDHALAIVDKTDEKETKANLYNNIGNLYNKQAQYQKSLENFTKATKINEELFGKDANHYATNLINIGNAYKDLSDLETAMKTYMEALNIYQKTPPDEISNMIDLFINMSRVTDDLGMSEQSQVIMDQAMKLAVQHSGENSLEQADVYMSMAVTAFNKEEFDQSLSYNFKSLSILDANNYPKNTSYAVIYNNIGQAYDELHDIELALKYKHQALDLYTQLYGPEHPSVAMVIANIGLTYEMDEQYDKAIEYLKQALTIRMKTQDPMHEDIGTTYMNIGLCYLKKTEFKQGLEYLEKARIIYDPYNKHVMKAMVYNRLAVGNYVLHDYAKAARYYQKAIIANTLNFQNENFDTFPEKPDFLDYYELLISYTAKTDIYTQRGDRSSLLLGVKQLDAADKILKDKAVDLTNAKDRLELAEVNSFFTESGMLLSHKLYNVTRDQAHLEKAYYYSERSKANELLVDIQLSRATAIGRIPKKVLTKRSDITRRMNTLQQQIATAYDTQNQTLIAQLKAREFDLTKEFNAVQAEVANYSSAIGTISTQRALPSWGEVKKSLDAKTAIVSYTLTDSAKYILVGNSSKLILKEIPPKTDLDKLVRGYVNQIKFQGPAVKQLAIQLTDLLWTPVEVALAEFGGIANIIILPDGPLNYLPFESLGKDHYILEKYTIHYQLSGALLMNTAQNTIKNKPSFIALAPVFADKETNFVNKSCERFVKLAQKADTTSRSFSLNGDYISPLPATETEVEKINQIHADKGIFTKYFVREAAREELIKKGELADFDYIHFATHGFVNSQYPELSGLLLTQDANSTEDGILFTGEILGLSLKADLVTLSACETALGKKIEGEGVRGLTTAFLFAGAKSVVASLWKVADESTAILMISFYTELLAGKDKASALRAAKLSLINGGQYYHPFYWAPFVQIGGN